MTIKLEKFEKIYFDIEIKIIESKSKFIVTNQIIKKSNNVKQDFDNLLKKAKHTLILKLIEKYIHSVDLSNCNNSFYLRIGVNEK